MILFYGSNGLIDKPIYGYGSLTNDYGRGFYLTPDKDMANLWASKFSNGYSITYDLDLTDLNVLNLSSNTKEDTLRWIALLIKNRFDDRTKAKNTKAIEWLNKYYSIDTSSYDVIIGYRADDTYFNYSKAFLKNEISLETLEKAMKMGNLGKQVVLISEKAFSKITRVSFEKIEQSNVYSNFVTEATSRFFELKAKGNKNSVYLNDLMEGDGSK